MPDFDIASLLDNPMGTDGIEFVEFASADPDTLGQLFVAMGFVLTARHRSKQVLLYRQGEINFIINAEQGSFASQYAGTQLASICAVALRVKDAAMATRRARELGAWEVQVETGVMELHIPAFQGVGGSLIYLVDRYRQHSIYDVDFVPVDASQQKTGPAGLSVVQQLIQTVKPGKAREWIEFYRYLFGFTVEESALADSHIMKSACGKLCWRIDEVECELPDNRREALTGVQLACPSLQDSQQVLIGHGLQVQTIASAVVVSSALLPGLNMAFELVALPGGLA